MENRGRETERERQRERRVAMEWEDVPHCENHYKSHHGYNAERQRGRRTKARESRENEADEGWRFETKTGGGRKEEGKWRGRDEKKRGEGGVTRVESGREERAEGRGGDGGGQDRRERRDSREKAWKEI